MTGLILVDTTPLVALCDPRDSLHDRARRDLARVKHQMLVACEPIMTEACFLLPHAIQRQRLCRLVHELPVKRLSDEGAEIWPSVFEWLEKYSEHEPDWADGYLVSLVRHIDDAKIWTYDKEFSTTWRDLRGKRLRLFVNPQL